MGSPSREVMLLNPDKANTDLPSVTVPAPAVKAVRNFLLERFDFAIARVFYADNT